MRPIDADALLVKSIEEKRFTFSYKDALNQQLVMETVYHDLTEFILSAPTIDVEPVRHGWWKITNTPLGQCCICSMCGSCPAVPYDYCPYCGTKMDLEGE